MSEENKNMDCEVPEVGNGAASELTRIVRYCLTAVGGYMIGKGWIGQDVLDAAVAIGTTATPIITGVVIGRLNRKKLVKAVTIAKGKTNGEG